MCELVTEATLFRVTRLGEASCRGALGCLMGRLRIDRSLDEPSCCIDALEGRSGALDSSGAMRKGRAFARPSPSRRSSFQFTLAEALTLTLTSTETLTDRKSVV